MVIGIKISEIISINKKIKKKSIMFIIIIIIKNVRSFLSFIDFFYGIGNY